MRRFDLLTIFPDFFASPLKTSLLGKAVESHLLEVRIHDIRDWAVDRHGTVDDLPYGGGPGRVMRPEPIVQGLETIPKEKRCRRIYFSPRGRLLRQADLPGYLLLDQLILLCGRYEGVDQRVLDHFIDEELSVGDYVLNGGEAAALVFIEALSRLMPGFIGSEESLGEESFSSGRLEYPHYTRPELFRGHQVPPVLLSGDHKKIKAWRENASHEITLERRPDLLKGHK
ncbi:MAG: tRNA (guanosine(37)-N1)-methyltransferase TrmD [Deltaproteobacteria bacterium]|nr:tRNA (guanosine(37)-N1)-methyltransferase TrmD [Deltaproteobacteria bacterium]MBI4374610.1 tRNA (guanosine(37)-N1)-methyltransferase TrmD [Deltaproteobacteria bacterium]